MKYAYNFVLVGLLICLSLHNSLAQKENNHWFFGIGAGINFNDSVQVLSGETNTKEGCATISHRTTGELLFYTDGRTVWNAKHAIMPNGTNLLGHYSSTQSAVIVPNPADEYKYFIFSPGHPPTNTNQFSYSEVDMRLNGGTGDVVAGSKNTILFDNSTEKIAAVKNANDDGYWVLGHTMDNVFWVYPITKTGIGSPQRYYTGSNLEGNMDWAGYMKFSPDGKRIANALRGSLHRVEIFDFDKETGAISYLRYTLPGNAQVYGVEFSPDNKLLYVAEMNNSNRDYNGCIYQYNLSSGIEAIILQTKTYLIANSNISYGALQLAPNGKIYASKKVGASETGVAYLGVINSPNEIGFYCDYIDDGLFLEGNYTLVGLPTMISNVCAIKINYDSFKLCYLDTARFHLVTDYVIDSLRWNFNDGPSGNQNTAITTQPLHLFTSPGEYQVKTTAYRYYCSDSIVKIIQVLDRPKLNLGNDTLICAGSLLKLNVATKDATYSWQDGTTSPIYDVVTSGTYSVNIEIGKGCNSTDTIKVVVASPEISSVEPVDISCNGRNDGKITINAVEGHGKLAYSIDNRNFQDVGLFPELRSGVYHAVVRDTNNCVDMKINIAIREPDKLTFEYFAPKHISCFGEDDGAILYQIAGGTKDYQITVTNQAGATPPSTNKLSHGIYSMNVTDTHGCQLAASTQILEPEKLEMQLATTPVTCNGGYDGTITSTVHGGIDSLPYTYRWSNGNYDKDIYRLFSGYYTLHVTDANFCTVDSMVFVPQPTDIVAKIKTTDIRCFGDDDGSIDLDVEGGTGVFLFNWNNGATQQDLTQLKPGEYAVTVTDTLLRACAAAYTVITEPPLLEITLIDTAMCVNSSSNGEIEVSITGGVKDYAINWSNGATGLKLVNLIPDFYTLTVTDTNQCTEQLSVEIDSYNCLLYREIPNVFTPNNDNLNDYFAIRAEKVSTFDVQIINRWGMKIYAWTNPDEKWDGTLLNTGADAPSGVYYYIATAHCFNGETFTVKGFLHLVREK